MRQAVIKDEKLSKKKDEPDGDSDHESADDLSWVFSKMKPKRKKNVHAKIIMQKKSLFGIF